MQPTPTGYPLAEAWHAHRSLHGGREQQRQVKNHNRYSCTGEHLSADYEYEAQTPENAPIFFHDPSNRETMVNRRLPPFNRNRQSEHGHVQVEIRGQEQCPFVSSHHRHSDTNRH